MGGRTVAKAFVESLDESREPCISSFDAADLSESQFLNQVVLQRTVGSFHATLRLAGVGAQDLDVQLCECTTELCHALPALRIAVDAEHRVLIGVKGDWTAMRGQIAMQCFELAGRAFAVHEPQLHKLAGRVVDEDQ